MRTRAAPVVLLYGYLKGKSSPSVCFSSLAKASLLIRELIPTTSKGKLCPFLPCGEKSAADLWHGRCDCTHHQELVRPALNRQPRSRPDPGADRWLRAARAAGMTLIQVRVVQEA